MHLCSCLLSSAFGNASLIVSVFSLPLSLYPLFLPLFVSCLLIRKVYRVTFSTTTTQDNLSTSLCITY